MQLSIIICTYNSKERLRKTLDSVLAQDVDDYEIVIIDGASDDGTVDIIREYEKKSKGKLKWISEIDTGIYNAMNKGVRMAKGKYLNVIGAGDWLETDSLKKVYKCMNSHMQVDAIQGILRIWSSDLSHHNLIQTKPEELRRVPMQHPALYYKKELHDKFGLYDESYKIVADYLFCMKVFYVGKATTVLLNEIVGNYVLDGVSSTNDNLCKEENARARKSLGLSSVNPFRAVKVFLRKYFARYF